MEDRIKNIVCQIANDIKRIPEYDDSIMKNLGSLMFVAEYSKYQNISLDSSQLNLFINTINNYEVNEKKLQTFSEGYLSYGILFHWLQKNGFIQKNELLEDYIQEISILSGEQQLGLKNWDFLYGATGIIHYIIMNGNTNEINIQFIKKYIDCLCSCKFNINNGIAWEDYYFRIREGKRAVNLGLAHGIPAILKTLALIYKNYPTYCPKGFLIKIKSIVAFLVNSRNKNEKTISSYSNNIYVDQPIEETSRLAWCYGDLCIGFTLYQVGRIINDNEICEYGKSLIHQTTKRKTLRETSVYDAGICHGSAGVAHIYNRMWHYTQAPIFKEATDYWIQKTLDFAIHSNGIAGYKKYNPLNNNYENDYGFLEGVAGIGIVLLSYMTMDFSWDYTLMLND